MNLSALQGTRMVSTASGSVGSAVAVSRVEKRALKCGPVAGQMQAWKKS